MLIWWDPLSCELSINKLDLIVQQTILLLTAVPSSSVAAPKPDGAKIKKVVDDLKSADSDDDEDSDKKSGSRKGDEDDEDDEDYPDEDEDYPETTKKPEETKHHHHVHVHPKDSSATKKPKSDCNCKTDKGASRSGELGDSDATTTKAPGSDSTSVPDSAKSADSSTTTTSSPDSADSTTAPPTGGSRGALKETAKPDDDDQDSVEDYTDEGEYRHTLAPNSSRAAVPDAPSIVTVNSQPMNSTVISTSKAPRPKNTPITIKPLTSTKQS